MSVTPEEWIAALESGDYCQGQLGLYSPGRYCCLGVLVELETGCTPSTCALYPASSKLFAYQDLMVKIPSGEIVPVSTLNDYGLPFKEIAKILRSNLHDGKFDHADLVPLYEGTVSIAKDYIRSYNADSGSPQA